MKKIVVSFLITGMVFSFVSCGKAKNETKETKSAVESETKLAVVEEEEMSKKEEPKFVEGEILVKFKPEVSEEEIAKIIKEEYRCEVLDVIKGLDVYRLKIPAGKKVPEMVELFSKDERVKYAEPNLIYRLQQ